MKVKELVEILKKLNQDKSIFLSHDSEGNSYGTITEDSFESTEDFYIIYPYEEYIEYDELRGKE